MRLHPRCAVVLMFLLVPTTAQAHIHVWDFAFSFAEAQGSSLIGPRLSIGLTQKIGPRPNRDFSWLIDITNVKDHDDDNQDIMQLSYLGGGRYTIPRIRTNHVVFMLHGIGGVRYKQRGADGERNWVLNTGLSVEWIPKGAADGWALRAQADYSFLPEEHVTGFRQLSFGVVKRFK